AEVARGAAGDPFDERLPAELPLAPHLAAGHVALAQHLAEGLHRDAEEGGGAVDVEDLAVGHGARRRLALAHGHLSCSSRPSAGGRSPPGCRRPPPAAPRPAPTPLPCPHTLASL